MINLEEDDRFISLYVWLVHLYYSRIDGIATDQILLLCAFNRSDVPIKKISVPNLMFSKPLSPFEELKTNKSVFYSEPEVLPCFELNYKFSKRLKKTSFARDNEKTRKSCEHGPENG